MDDTLKLPGTGSAYQSKPESPMGSPLRAEDSADLVDNYTKLIETNVQPILQKRIPIFL